MAQTTITDGIKMLVERHKAAEGTLVGNAAIAACKKISNADPSEGVWNKGDKFTVPAADEIEQAIFVAMVNGNKAPAVAVETNNGPKVLYISSLKKNVIEYEEDGDQFIIKKDAAGNNIPAHIARVGGDGLNEGTDETPLRKEVMKLATVESIINYLAGKTIECVGVMGPYKTSRLKAKTNALGQRDGYEVVGLRNTSIPVFEEVTA